MRDRSQLELSVTETDFIEALKETAETADGAFALDSDGRILHWNRAAERITGLSAEQAVGRSCCEVMQGRDRCGNTVCIPRCHIQTMAERGEPPRAYDLQVPHVTRGQLWLNMSTILVRDKNGEVDVTFHLFRDMPPRREAEHGTFASHRGMAAPDGAPCILERLTPRETNVLHLIALGTPHHAISERLSISVTTVRTHTQNILKKLGVHSKLEAVALAHRHGLVG